MDKQDAYDAGADAGVALCDHNRGCHEEARWDVDHFGAFITWGKEHALIGDYVPTEPSALEEAARALWPAFCHGYADETSMEYVG